MSLSGESLRVLIIGGSGFLSGTLARTAIAAGHKVWTVTRGERPLPEGATGLIADRHNAEVFRETVRNAGMRWDLAVDCIGYDPSDALQDLEVLEDLADHFVLISTDFTFDPAHRTFPQPEESDHYAIDESYGAKKRRCELLLADHAKTIPWTVLRPCHIYGPGSLLGCLPAHSRDKDLIAKIQDGQPLDLVGGGHFLQQPILAEDLSNVILSLHGNSKTHGETYCTAGPDIVESHEYYRIIARCLSVPEPEIRELPVGTYLAENPQSSFFLCHRIYRLDKLAECGAHVPSTSIEEGLRKHVESLIGQ